ncbi:MAG: hypothetical protein HZB21_05165, partial [Deltaproteobacteria bacterium]|nr:hypothetical protein [Deltaproteobacteria bacterium]
DANHVVFKPAKLTEKELLEGLISAYRDFYSLPSIAKRILRPGNRRLIQSLTLNVGRYLRRKRFEDTCRMQ